MNTLDEKIKEALKDKPKILAQYVITNPRPWEMLGAYIGEDKEGSTKSFHEYRKLCDTWYEAIQYDIHLWSID